MIDVGKDVAILGDLRGRVVTAGEFAKLTHPPCPACSVPVLLKTAWSGCLDGFDRWTVTDWACPSGCTPPA